MKVSKLLHKKLRSACPKIHKVRLSALIAGVHSALEQNQVTVTGLGRNLKSYSRTSTKHDIKRMDRLIGNKYLYQERQSIYHYLLTQLIGEQTHPILIADWSPIPGNRIFQLLRLSIPMGGRSLTVYEQCYEESQLNRTDVHNDFLDNLGDLLPTGCQPIILSDAIFKTQWFKKIESKGWFWVGRVRGNVQLSLDNGLTFLGCTHVMKQAKRQPSSIGKVLYSKVNQFTCDGVLYHGTLKGKHRIKKRGGKSKDGSSLYYARKAKQPWLLISSLPQGMRAPKKVVKLYRYRMQIEVCQPYCLHKFKVISNPNRLSLPESDKSTVLVAPVIQEAA